MENYNGKGMCAVLLINSLLIFSGQGYDKTKRDKSKDFAQNVCYKLPV